jgi:DNA-binding CsgD family transcriptional regulator
VSTHLQHGRECYESRDWTNAYESLSAADRASALDPCDLQRLATTAHLLGRDVEFQQLLDRLHRAQLDARDGLAAARSAFWLSLSSLFRGDVAQANGWVARGQRLIEGTDCVEQGYLLLPVLEQDLRAGKIEVALKTSATAAAIGERFRDIDLTVAARHAQGRALIRLNQVSTGLRLLDEVMLAVVAGEVSPIMTGLMYCSVIEACGEVYAFSRAREWTFAMSKWCAQQPSMLAFTGVCLVHRAEIMQFHGDWPEAMTEARHACEQFERVLSRPPAAAFYQQAEIHRLRGEFTEAEAIYRDASRMGYEPQPGLALLRLAQGRIDAARAAIHRIVSVTTDRARSARLLPAHIEIMLTAGDREEARRACGVLEKLAEDFDTDVLRAVAMQARGAIELASGDARAALGPLRSAFDVLERLEAPYGSARVRVLIGQACHALGDDETSTLEFDAARAAFEKLGAQPDLDRLDTIARRDARRRTHPLTARECDVLRLIAAGHTNKAIAATLSLSERTIDRHVSNILSKLDVPSRTAATAYAYDHKLF